MEYRSDFLAEMTIIDHGHIIYDGAIKGMKERLAPHRVLVVDFADRVADIQVDRAELMEGDGRRARFRFNRWEVLASELVTELAQRYSVKDISVEEPEIETIVREIYQRENNE